VTAGRKTLGEIKGTFTWNCAGLSGSTHLGSEGISTTDNVLPLFTGLIFSVDRRVYGRDVLDLPPSLSFYIGIDIDR
jgi:hypothetical protein